MLFLLKTFWKEIAIAIFVLGFAWYVRHLYITVQEQTLTIKIVQAENKILRDNESKLLGAMNATTKSFEKIDGITQQINDRFKTLNNQISSTTNTLNNQLTSILNEQKPIDCPATINYLIDAAKGYAK